MSEEEECNLELATECEECGMFYYVNAGHECKPDIPVRLSFKVRSNNDLNKIFEAERQLQVAGIEFDTGYDFILRKRDWQFEMRVPDDRYLIVEKAKTVAKKNGIELRL